MSDILDDIHKGLALAFAKGCPVESIWVNETTHNTLSIINARTHHKVLDGYHVSVVRMSHSWAIKLECGWTDRNGEERTDIIPIDVAMEYAHVAKIDTSSMEAHPLWASFG